MELFHISKVKDLIELKPFSHLGSINQAVLRSYDLDLDETTRNMYTLNICEDVKTYDELNDDGNTDLVSVVDHLIEKGILLDGIEYFYLNGTPILFNSPEYYKVTSDDSFDYSSFFNKYSELVSKYFLDQGYEFIKYINTFETELDGEFSYITLTPTKVNKIDLPNSYFENEDF